MTSRWKIALSTVGVALIAMVVTVVIAARQISLHARDWVQEGLTQYFKSDVELSSFNLSVYPSVRAQGEDLILHFQGRNDLPPLIAIKSFTVHARLLELLLDRHVQRVDLNGLEINIPPARSGDTGGRFNFHKAPKSFGTTHFDQIVSENAVLKILTSKPGKDPLEFDIAHLILHSTASDGELAFRATLTNPTPPGDILSTGKFGPWNADAPRLTPVSGTYTLDNANLGVFRGIGGTLSSRGEYKGVLERIEANGTTDTPDFQITRAEHPVDLKTTFHAVVDGTDGDTFLDPVEVHYMKTTLIARGTVEGTKGIPGKKITLDVIGNKARIEDLLLFAIKGPPTMTGPIQLTTKFVLVPGQQEILDRLSLNGSFDLPSAHFTSGRVQQKLDNLSKRGRGDAKEVAKDPQAVDSTDDVASSMKGNFQLGNDILRLSGLGFAVEGATVNLDGIYDLSAQTLDLHGNLEMEAKLSHATTGMKSFFLKAADPFFSKDGKGTVLPIKITGPVTQPKYGSDFHRKRESAKLG